jgi:hypothetical protein
MATNQKVVTDWVLVPCQNLMGFDCSALKKCTNLGSRNNISPQRTALQSPLDQDNQKGKDTAILSPMAPSVARLCGDR